MRAPVVLGLVALAACGEDVIPTGPPLPEAANVTIVAHQDDDLLFMQPDLTDIVEDRTGLLNVYVTAGQGRKFGTEAIEAAGMRYLGLTKAYAQAAGLAPDWQCGVIEIEGHTAEHCRLEAANVSLVFLAYPDGGKEGELSGSLLRLWEGTIDGAWTIAMKPSHYDRPGLIAAVASIIRTAKPTTIRTLEISSTHGRDHVDHMIAGALAVLATADARSRAQLISYRGYGTEEEPETLIPDLYGRSANLLAHYDACALGCAECGKGCPAISDTHEIWLRRRYAIGTRAAGSGALRNGGMCAGLNADGSPTFGPCGANPTHWELAADGTLHANDRCLVALPTGELATSPSCTPDPERRFVLDDEGHLWLGTPPLAEPDMAYAHLWCLGVAGGRPRALLCGKDRAPRWELSEAAVTAPRTIPSLPGRAVRLGDVTGDRKADLCFVVGTALMCADGLGDGTFGAPSARAALAIEPESLVLGDVDGDRRLDACGRDASGLLCALAANGYAAMLWSPSFARAGGADASDRSLAATDANGDGVAEICGLGEQGVVCVPRGLSAVSAVRSKWPASDAPMWAGDLDGDRRADWCVARPDGPACGLDRDRELTTDGVPWSFALAGARDAAPTTTSIGALGDIDGDGRADLCTVRDRSILCARSTGNGFGPQTPFATLPPGGALTALWLGDLDGDGTLDACAEDGAQITCVRN